jgi:hypothetical protein
MGAQAQLCFDTPAAVRRVFIGRRQHNGCLVGLGMVGRLGRYPLYVAGIGRADAGFSGLFASCDGP